MLAFILRPAFILRGARCLFEGLPNGDDLIESVIIAVSARLRIPLEYCVDSLASS